MNKREWLWRGTGVVAAFAVCGALCLFAYLGVLFVIDLRPQLPYIVALVIALGSLVFGLGFVPATGAVMGIVAAVFWQRCTASKIALNRWCSLICFAICLVGCAFELWAALPLLLVFSVLTQAMWWGMEMGFEWLPRQPWRYFLGQTPYAPDETEPDYKSG